MIVMITAITPSLNASRRLFVMSYRLFMNTSA
jgi:hypothetical protein